MLDSFHSSLVTFKSLLVCPICQQFYKDPYLLGECGHCFCKDCAIRTIASSGKCYKCNLPAIIRNMHRNISYFNIVNSLKEFEFGKHDSGLKIESVEMDSRNTESQPTRSVKKDLGEEEITVNTKIEKKNKRSKDTKDKKLSELIETSPVNNLPIQSNKQSDNLTKSENVIVQLSQHSNNRYSDTEQFSIKRLFEIGKLRVGDKLEYLGQFSKVTKQFKLQDCVEREDFEGPTEWASFIQQNLLGKKRKINGWKSVSLNGTMLQTLFTTEQNIPSQPLHHFVFSGLSEMHKQILRDIPHHSQLQYEISKTVTGQTTHIITSITSNEKTRLCTRTLKYLEGLLNCCWIVSFEWLLQCLSESKWVSEEPFLIRGDTSTGITNAPSLVRVNQSAKKLFDGCTFDLSCYLGGSLSTDDLLKLIASGNGTVKVNVGRNGNRKKDKISNTDNVYFIHSDSFKGTDSRNITISFLLNSISSNSFP